MNALKSLSRILVVHNRYRERGGEDVSVNAETTLLANAGLDVKHVKVHNEAIPNKLSPMAQLKLGGNSIWSTESRARIKHEVDTFTPDIAHFHNTFPLVSPAAYSACAAAGVAVVQTLHNYRLLCPSATFYRDGHPCEDCLGKTPPIPGVVHGCYHGSRSQTAVVAAMLTAHRIRRTWTRDVDRYIALTEFARSKLIEGGLPPDRISVKQHFVADPGKSPHKSGTGFVYVGRLVPEKGIETMLAAWALLQRHELKVIGTGPLEPTVVRAAAELSGISYLGSRDIDCINNVLQPARALVMPSIWFETFGLTIIEAFACGTPVIASRLGAMAEIVEDGATGLLFEPGNAEDLATKVRWAADHPEEMRRMGENARREYEAKYTPERNYALLMDIYQQAIDLARMRRTR